MSKPRVLRSDCKQYYAVNGPSQEDWMPRIFDQKGAYLGRATYWSNRDTSTHAGFETGFDDISATFRYRHHPSWFRRRWIECWSCKLEEATELIEAKGGEVLVAYKFGMTVMQNLGFRASSSVLAAIDAEMKLRGWKFKTRKEALCWDVSCPDEARTWPRYPVTLDLASAFPEIIQEAP